MMRKFRHIESWASHLGYVVEKIEDNSEVRYMWYRERSLEFKMAIDIKDLMEKITEEIKLSYEGLE